jgi:predicted aspartyl protease
MRLAVISALLCLAGAPLVQAQTCGPLKLISSQQMAHFGSTDVMVVPVTLNGAAKGMIFDTGAAETQLSRTVVKELKLPVLQRNSEAHDVSGHVSRDVALIQLLSFGKMRRRGIGLRVWPDPDFARDTPLLAGVLSRDLLFDYDVDADFGTGILKLFSKDHCFGAIDYWHPPAMAVMKFTIRSKQIHIPVTLDGHALDAMIDTGSQYSIISQPVAQRVFGLTPASPDVKPLGAVNNDPALTGFVRTFGTLSFGGVTVLTPDMMILPDKVNRDRSQQSENRALFNNASLVLPQVTIGMDVLRHLHIYLAPDERNFYVALADPPPAKP